MPGIRTHHLDLLTDELSFGESPRWHDGQLWFTDVLDRSVNRLDGNRRIHVVVRTRHLPSGLGWLPNGRLLVVSQNDHTLLRLDPSGLTPVANVSRYCGGFLNDLVVDAVGRSYISNVGFDYFAEPMEFAPTNLVRVDPDGTVDCVASDLLCPNGLGITPDGKTLVVAQSLSPDVVWFDIDSQGRLSRRRVYGRLPGEATGDGICLDEAGAVWIACPMSGEFLRMLPGGDISDRVDTGGRMAVACALGGNDRRSLYCITATKPLQKAEGLGNSQISTVRVSTRGAEP